MFHVWQSAGAPSFYIRKLAQSHLGGAPDMAYHQLSGLQGLSSHASNEVRMRLSQSSFEAHALRKTTTNSGEIQQQPCSHIASRGYSMAYLWDMVIKSYAETSRDRRDPGRSRIDALGCKRRAPCVRRPYKGLLNGRTRDYSLTSKVFSASMIYDFPPSHVSQTTR